MGMFFAPIANLVLSAVRPEEEGKASGASNAIREVGGVFGVAVLASVFSANGSYASPQAYVDGMVPAVWLGAAVVGVAAVAALAIPRWVAPGEPSAADGATSRGEARRQRGRLTRISSSLAAGGARARRPLSFGWRGQPPWSTDRMLPAGSLNQAIFGPSLSREIPRASCSMPS